MINYLSEKLAGFLAAKANYSKDEDRYKTMLFFIKALFHTGFKSIFLLVAALIISLRVSEYFFIYMIFLMCIYGMIKRFSFGVHSSNEAICTVIGFVYYIGGTFLAMYIEIPFILAMIIMIICFIINWKYAPSPTVKRKIGEKENKKFKGYTLSIYGDVFVFAIIFKITGLPVFFNLILIAAIWQSVTIHPISYKLLGERRGDL